MDQTSPSQQSTEPQGVVLKPNNGKKAGLLKIILAGIVIILFLGILNYFNILPISDLYQKKSSNIPPNTPIPIQQTNLPTPASKPTFQYDTKKAETLLTQYIKDNIKPEFLPEKIEVKQGVSIDGRQTNLKNEFGSHFTLPNKDTFSANFHFKQDSNDPNDFTIFLQPAGIQDTALTPSIANSVASSYFNNPYPITSCTTKKTTQLCEVFLSEDEEKRGYGLIFADDRRKFAPFLFTCSVPKTSQDYASQKSCIDL